MNFTTKPDPRRIVAFLILIMLVFMLLSLVFGQLRAFTAMSGSRCVSAQPFFTVSCGGTKYADIASFTESKPALSFGSVVELHGILPKKEGFSSQALSISTYYCGIEVFCGGELLYSYGDPENQKVVGGGYHFIALPADYAEKDLIIRLSVTDPNSLFDTQSLYFGEWEPIYLNHIRQNIIVVCIDIFMLVLGCVLVAVSLIGLIYSRQFVVILSVGLISLVGGLWAMCNSRYIQLFTDDLDLILQLEFQSFYLLIFVMLAYVYIIVRKSRPLRLSCAVLFLITFLSVLAIELLQYFDIKDYSETLSAYHLLTGLDFAAFFVMTIYRIRTAKKAGSEIFFLTAVIGTALFAAVDYAVFYYNRSSALSASPIVSLPFGMMFFIVTMLLSGIFYLLNTINDRNERLILKQLAFSDVLTSLGNRAKCEEVVSSLIESGTDFTFVLFDLNNLKRINDTMGHKVGDSLLSGFGNIIVSAFPLSPAVCRIGGDEFGVILPYTDDEAIANALKKYELINAERSRENDLNFSAAYGCATSTEVCGASWEDMYKLADSRMYQMKSEMHKAEASAFTISKTAD